MAVRKKRFCLLFCFWELFSVFALIWRFGISCRPIPGFLISPPSVSRIPQVNWLLGRFQPVFLYPFTRGGSGFLRVAYRDPAWHIRLMNIYVGRAARLAWL